MRVLVLHNRYRELGGEDRVVHEEVNLLRRYGHEVELLECDNEGSSAQLALGAAWSLESRKEVLRACRAFRPHVAHIHNFWMRLSPSAHSACGVAGVPTVQTLHNFRLLCVNALLMRDGHVCEDCVGRTPLLGVVRRCYRQSTAASAAVAGMITINRARGTWRKDVRVFIAPSHHTAAKLIAGGIDAARMVVKPHFAADPGTNFARPSESRDIVFAGRLSEEKGAMTLVRAWRGSGLSRLGTLRIIGDGPERAALESAAGGEVEFMGSQPPERVQELMANARAVAVPSLCFETFGRTVVEAFACGRPVVASAIGAIGEAVQNGRTGLTFPAGDEGSLRTALGRILRDRELANEFGASGRKEYLARYTPDRNYELLRAIYETAMGTESEAEAMLARRAG
jgi:glycosyltransferase involved in cell wall biosynthesis